MRASRKSRDVSHCSALMRSTRQRAPRRERAWAPRPSSAIAAARMNWYGRTVAARPVPAIERGDEARSLSAPVRRRSGGSAASATLSSGSVASRVSTGTSSTTAAARAVYIRTCQVACWRTSALGARRAQVRVWPARRTRAPHAASSLRRRRAASVASRSVTRRVLAQCRRARRARRGRREVFVDRVQERSAAVRRDAAASPGAQRLEPHHRERSDRPCGSTDRSSSSIASPSRRAPGRPGGGPQVSSRRTT